MTSNWPLVRLQEVTSVLGDGLHGTPEYDESGDYYFINGNNLSSGRIVINATTKRVSTSQYEKYKKKLNDRTILVSINGTLGNVALYNNEKVILGKSACYFNVVEGVDKQFVRYVLAGAGFQNYIHSLATGSTIKNVSLKLMRDFTFRLPTLNLQKAISGVLEALDKRISLIRETNATLESIAQALFKSWFVDFDPVRAKQEGRAPEGMDADTAALFPDGFAESEIGMLPREWQASTLGDIANTARSQAQPSDLSSTTNYIGLEHIPRASLSLMDWDSADGLESAKSRFCFGDVLFGKLRPYFHKVVIAPIDGVCSTDILVCRPKELEFYALMVMHLSSKTLIDYADRLSNGAKMPRVNWKDLEAYPIAVPPASVAKRYGAIIYPLFQRMNANIHAARTLADIRDILLPRLISGQLRLPEAQEQLCEALTGT
jgi:type I restriction enzyme, S subunit